MPKEKINKKIKAILFDRDGTIVDSETTHMNAVCASLEEQDVHLTEEEKISIAGKHPSIYIPLFRRKYDFDIEKWKLSQRKKYYSMMKEAVLFDEVIKQAWRLKKHYKLGLCTSSGNITTNELLERTELKDLFDEVITSNDVNNYKPDPEPYLLLAKKLNVKPEECIVIEDSPSGIASGKAANMTVIALVTKYVDKQDIQFADFVLDDKDKIVELIASLQPNTF